VTMFRSSVNPFDEVVGMCSSHHNILAVDHDTDTCKAKATDENLTSENWESILDVCDQVNAKPDEGYNRS